MKSLEKNAIIKLDINGIYLSISVLKQESIFVKVERRKQYENIWQNVKENRGLEKKRYAILKEKC